MTSAMEFHHPIPGSNSQTATNQTIIKDGARLIDGIPSRIPDTQTAPWVDKNVCLEARSKMVRVNCSKRRQQSPNIPIINSSRLSVVYQCRYRQLINNKETTSTTGSLHSISDKTILGQYQAISTKHKQQGIISKANALEKEWKEVLQSAKNKDEDCEFDLYESY
uniref:Uncharacterized protein n=1 Tax=Onchocerca volvulus TaxID=6282 RepID=A0A8R1TMT4_ONCVO